MPDTENAIQETGIPILKMTVQKAESEQWPVDKTLSISEEAADAKATGDAIRNLKTDLEEKIEELYLDALTSDKVEKEFVTEGYVPDSKALGEKLTEMNRQIETAADDISALNDGLDSLNDSVKELDGQAIKKVNGIAADKYGEAKVTEVDNARELMTEDNQDIREAFTTRITAIDNLSTVHAKLRLIEGRQAHNGYIPETLDMTVEAMPREDESETITATLNKEAFRAYVTESTAIDLYYTSAWNRNPSNYGITISGQPISGDHIRIEYVKEDRGTIFTASPEKLISTGWNQYQAENGYARLCRYSDLYGYRIEGAYESLTFATEPDGDGEVITTVDGWFQIPSDGYVIVTEGDETTCIYPTLTDWTEGHTGDFEAYSESVIDLTDIMSNFPYGLCKVGAAADEIDLDSRMAIRWIDRMEYSDENLTEAKESGRNYAADTDYIYIVRAVPITSDIAISGEYLATSHGLEILDGTEIPCQANILYGESMADKLKNKVITWDMTVGEIKEMGA